VLYAAEHLVHCSPRPSIPASKFAGHLDLAQTAHPASVNAYSTANSNIESRNIL